MPTAVDNIVESSPQTVVTPIVGMPTYDNMMDQIYQILYNTESMQMMIDGGNLNLLALAISPTVYTNLSATSFVEPSNPGLAPMIPSNAIGNDQTIIRYNFTLNTELYMLHQNMDKDLKKKLLGVVEDIYIRLLKKNYIDYRNHTCL